MIEKYWPVCPEKLYWNTLSKHTLKGSTLWWQWPNSDVLQRGEFWLLLQKCWGKGEASSSWEKVYRWQSTESNWTEKKGEEKHARATLVNLFQPVLTLLLSYKIIYMDSLIVNDVSESIQTIVSNVVISVFRVKMETNQTYNISTV